MPRTVDHDERRGAIIAGLLRVAGREGLAAVTMRAVAAEAGVSLRLVQYYFQSKAALLRATLDQLEAQSHARWAARLAYSPGPVSTRQVLEAFLAEALPTDASSRTFHLVWTSYAVLAMTDRELAEQPFVDGPNRLQQRLAELLGQAQAGGELAAELDCGVEAARLLSLSHGLGTSVLVGQRTADGAMTVLRYHLDRLFGCAAARDGC